MPSARRANSKGSSSVTMPEGKKAHGKAFHFEVRPYQAKVKDGVVTTQCSLFGVKRHVRDCNSRCFSTLIAITPRPMVFFHGTSCVSSRCREFVSIFFLPWKQRLVEAWLATRHREVTSAVTPSFRYLTYHDAIARRQFYLQVIEQHVHISVQFPCNSCPGVYLFRYLKSIINLE